MKHVGYRVIGVWCGTNFMVEAALGEFDHEAQAYDYGYRNDLSLMYSEMDQTLYLAEGHDTMIELGNADITVKHLPDYKHDYLDAQEDDFEPVFISIEEFGNYEDLYNVHDMDKIGARFSKIVHFEPDPLLQDQEGAINS